MSDEYMAEDKVDKASLRIKLENLQRREFEVQKDKKAMMADYRDQLKEIKDEIKCTLEQIDEIDAPTV